METFDVSGNCLNPLIQHGDEVSAVPTTLEEINKGDIIILFFNSGDGPTIKIHDSLSTTHIEVRQLNPPLYKKIGREHITHILKVTSHAIPSNTATGASHIYL